MTISDKGYLYIIDKKKGNIIRINNLHKIIKLKKEKIYLLTGFLVSSIVIFIYLIMKV